MDSPTTAMPPTRAHSGWVMRRSVAATVHAVMAIVTAVSTHTMGAPAVTMSGIEYDCDLSFRRSVMSPRAAAANTTSSTQAAT